MAKEITIWLKMSEDAGSGQSDPESAGNSSKDAVGAGKGSTSSKSSGSGNSGALAWFAAKQLASTAINTTINWALYEWNKTATLTDDYISQRNASIASSMIDKIGGAASTILSSTMSGAAIGGPWGAAIGAVVGTVSATANLATQYAQAIDQQNIMLRQMDASLNMTRNKVGWSTTAASIGENM